MLEQKSSTVVETRTPPVPVNLKLEANLKSMTCSPSQSMCSIHPWYGFWGLAMFSHWLLPSTAGWQPHRPAVHVATCGHATCSARDLEMLHVVWIWSGKFTLVSDSTCNAKNQSLWHIFSLIHQGHLTIRMNWISSIFSGIPMESNGRITHQ